MMDGGDRCVVHDAHGNAPARTAFRARSGTIEWVDRGRSQHVGDPSRLSQHREAEYRATTDHVQRPCSGEWVSCIQCPECISATSVFVRKPKPRLPTDCTLCRCARWGAEHRTTILGAQPERDGGARGQCTTESARSPGIYDAASQRRRSGSAATAVDAHPSLDATGHPPGPMGSHSCDLGCWGHEPGYGGGQWNGRQRRSRWSGTGMASGRRSPECLEWPG